MDGSHVDTLARAIAQRGTRRWLVRLVATLPLGGALTTRSADEAAAERPIDRLQRRTPQRNRQQRNTRKHNNNQNNNQNNNNGGGGGGGNGGQGGTCDCPGDLTCLPNGACGRVCADGSGCAGCTPTGSVCPPPARSGPSLSFCLWPDQTCDNTIACNPNERSFCSPGLACLQTACTPSAYRCVQVADCP
jgi:hypothetical protein